MTQVNSTHFWRRICSWVYVTLYWSYPLTQEFWDWNTAISDLACGLNPSCGLFLYGHRGRKGLFPTVLKGLLKKKGEKEEEAAKRPKEELGKEEGEEREKGEEEETDCTTKP